MIATGVCAGGGRQARRWTIASSAGAVGDAIPMPDGGVETRSDCVRHRGRGVPLLARADGWKGQDPPCWVAVDPYMRRGAFVRLSAGW